MKRIGSQLRETLAESGYRYVGRIGPGEIILGDEESGHLEIWGANDHHVGYTIQVGRWGYEFLRDYSVPHQTEEN